MRAWILLLSLALLLPSSLSGRARRGIMPTPGATNPNDALFAACKLKFPTKLRSSRVRAVVGVFTSYTDLHESRPKYNYTARRELVRQAWFPRDPRVMQLLESRGYIIRFVVGDPSIDMQRAMREMNDVKGKEGPIKTEIDFEEKRYPGTFMRLANFTEHYKALARKTMTFLRQASETWHPTWIIKVDDDTLPRLDRLLGPGGAIEQWEAEGVSGASCLKQGEVIRDPHLRWYEPQHEIFGLGRYVQYPPYPTGPAYALRGDVAATLSAFPEGVLREFANEDVSVGVWLMALNNVFVKNDRRMCVPAFTVCESLKVNLTKAAIPNADGGASLDKLNSKLLQSKLPETDAIRDTEARKLDYLVAWDWPWCAGFCNPVTSLNNLLAASDEARATAAKLREGGGTPGALGVKTAWGDSSEGAEMLGRAMERALIGNGGLDCLGPRSAEGWQSVFGSMPRMFGMPKPDLEVAAAVGTAG